MDERSLQQPMLSGHFRGRQQGPAANAGTHLWKVNAAWPSVCGRSSTGICAQRRLLQHAVRLPAAARPGQRRRLDGPGGQHPVRAAARAEVRISVMDTAGQREGLAEVPVTAAANATTPAGPLPEVVKDGRLHFIDLELSMPATASWNGWSTGSRPIAAGTSRQVAAGANRRHAAGA